MTEIVLATSNENKIKEIKAILKDLNLKILTFKDFSSFPEYNEKGKSFKENAIIKAKTTALFVNKIALADDSGLEVKALKNKPGVFSARFAKDGATDKENNERLLYLMKDIPFNQREAVFKCVIAIATPEGKVEITEGKWKGIISFQPKGNNGFGYDPLFIVPEYQKTSAELSFEEKNKISHRAKALIQAKQILKKGVNL